MVARKPLWRSDAAKQFMAEVEDMQVGSWHPFRRAASLHSAPNGSGNELTLPEHHASGGNQGTDQIAAEISFKPGSSSLYAP
jgi:hypothetical protein